jgi:hypothetical protein
VAHRNTQTSLRQLAFLSRGNAEKSEKKNLDDWRYRLVQQLESEGKARGHRWSYFFGKGRSNWLLELDSYADWKKSPTSSTFWLNGKLGSGKSVAMASICGDLTSSSGTGCGPSLYLTNGLRRSPTSVSHSQSLLLQRRGAGDPSVGHS